MAAHFFESDVGCGIKRKSRLFLESLALGLRWTRAPPADRRRCLLRQRRSVVSEKFLEGQMASCRGHAAITRRCHQAPLNLGLSVTNRHRIGRGADRTPGAAARPGNNPSTIVDIAQKKVLPWRNRQAAGRDRSGTLFVLDGNWLRGRSRHPIMRAAYLPPQSLAGRGRQGPESTIFPQTRFLWTR